MAQLLLILLVACCSKLNFLSIKQGNKETLLFIVNYISVQEHSANRVFFVYSVYSVSNYGNLLCNHLPPLCSFLADDFNTYQNVKQLENKFPRPVVILGPLAEPICDKLVIDWSRSFARCFEGMYLCISQPYKQVYGSQQLSVVFTSQIQTNQF